MTLAPSVDSGLRQPLGAVEEGDVADLPRAALKSPPPSLECPGGTPGVSLLSPLWRSGPGDRQAGSVGEGEILETGLSASLSSCQTSENLALMF